MVCNFTLQKRQEGLQKTIVNFEGAIEYMQHLCSQRDQDDPFSTYQSHFEQNDTQRNQSITESILQHSHSMFRYERPPNSFSTNSVLQKAKQADHDQYLDSFFIE